MAVIAAGIDGCRRGWVAVVLEDGRFHAATSGDTLSGIVEHLAAARVIGIDIPIGLPSRGRRAADVDARTFVGPRRNSVFFTAPRAVWEAPDYRAARDVAQRLDTGGVSAQAHALRAKVLEADAFATVESRLREVHPEVSFAALAGGHLAHPKSTWAGISLRRRLLREAGIELPDDLGPAGDAGVDDVLDAAVVAWSAARIAAGEARSLPAHPQAGPDGLFAAIWY